jgi:hypothetical protein
VEPGHRIELEPENPAEAATWTPAQGMWRGELLGLTWADADLESGVLAIERTLLELGGKLTEPGRGLHHGRRDSMSTGVPDPFQTVARPVPDSGDIPNVFAVQARWGGWGSNPRPADYERSGMETSSRSRRARRYFGRYSA